MFKKNFFIIFSQVASQFVTLSRKVGKVKNLMPIIEITNENFKNEFAETKTPVVMDFWGPSCTVCKNLMPDYSELAESPEYKNIKFCSVDTSQNRRVAVNLRVMSLPTFLFFMDGREIKRLSGSKIRIQDIKNGLEKFV